MIIISEQDIQALVDSIQDGDQAVYHSKNGPINVTICNVKKENRDKFFQARVNETGRLVDSKWSAKHALKGRTFTLLKKIVLPSEIEEEKVRPRIELRKFFETVMFDDKPFILDDEQLDAVLSNEHTLITARAGSGKTRVIIAKLIYLFEKKLLTQDNVLALCFNRDAGKEITERLNTKCKINGELKYFNYNIAKTFHSLSRQITERQGDILADRKKLIKNIITEFRNQDQNFAKTVYDFFRSEILRIDRKNFSSLESYYNYVRNCSYRTLNGEQVKSKTEKYIADFLFEHDIQYIYEKRFYPSKLSIDRINFFNKKQVSDVRVIAQQKRETAPDFYLTKHNIVWEHWAIDGSETQSEISDFNNAVGSYTDYLDNQKWKRNFWNTNWKNYLSYNSWYNKEVLSVRGFIETTHKQLDLDSREEVEKQLSSLLEKKGIFIKKLPLNVLIDKVWVNCIDSFTKLMDQFINKLQQNYLGHMQDFESLLRDKYCKNDRISAYCQLGYKIYKKYIDIINNYNNPAPFDIYNHYGCDFNQLLFYCASDISAGKVDDIICRLKVILIDEYQDFSELFNKLITAILSRNKNIKIFCVGDNWQAINRFAGSDIKFFNGFFSRYKLASSFNISSNYRSSNDIVQFSNRFMSKFGYYDKKPRGLYAVKGICEEIDISSLYVGKFNNENLFIKYFNEKEQDILEKAQYLSACYTAIKENPGKKIMILSRIRFLLGKSLEDFNAILQKTCANIIDKETYEKFITVKTVHTAKGEEADVVLILNVNEKIFPSCNSNNALLEVFGQTYDDAMEDEVKLYYVALTRAKEKLYILYDSRKKSRFIMTKDYNK
ncbi:MAG: UvrD-helicase domain-containing protein [Clostridia bacterium]|nr:UvrD-helicase domain-containing protein [Clostridia bacterium]